uniref:Uncharacterized protein n=1 Tax=Mus spicilegus TaxID=10103 RepID=A0A8C6HY10_MUSSI
MNFLLLALAFLVSAAEEPLQFSGKFHTVYLASKSVGAIAENSPERMLMHEVQFFNEHSVMSMTFYVRKNGICQLHTVWADKLPWNYCTKKATGTNITQEI